MKNERMSRKRRVYDIYGIPKKKRKDYQMHHIIFRSDKKDPIFEDFDIDKKANLYPLKEEEHKNLHKRAK